MAHSLRKSKGRADSGPVLVIPKVIINSDEYANLTAYEVKLLVDLTVQFNGYTNNGDLQCTWSIMRKRGWHSEDTLRRALVGLLAKRFIVRTRQGGRHKCSLYALTWVEIHECKGKLDVLPTRVPLRTWRKNSVPRLLEHATPPAVANEAQK